MKCAQTGNVFGYPLDGGCQSGNSNYASIIDVHGPAGKACYSDLETRKACQHHVELRKRTGGCDAKVNVFGLPLMWIVSQQPWRCEGDAIYHDVTDAAACRYEDNQKYCFHHIEVYDDGASIIENAREQQTFERFWSEHAEWSEKTFGTTAERGPVGPLKHLAKEVQEAVAEATSANPYERTLYVEIADCLFLVVDAARRAGMTPQSLLAEAFRKLEVNKKRTWSKPTSDEPVEHVRGENEAA